MFIQNVITGIPAQTINQVKVNIGGFSSDATSTILAYALYTTGNTIFNTGFVTLPPEQFSGFSISTITTFEDIVLNYLGVTRL